ncbi:MAG: NYN domain-containing protein [Myxococcota bacterium]
MGQSTETRVAVFVNGKTFYAGWREMGRGCQVDFAKMAQWLVRRAMGNALIGVHYYTALIDEGEDREDSSAARLQRFLQMLEYQPGFFVHRLPRKTGVSPCDHCGQENAFSSDKEVDVALVAHLLQQAAVDAYDVVLVMTGDADYAPALRSVQAMGKRAFVVSWGGSGMSKRLRAVAFDHIDLLAGITVFEHGLDAKEGDAGLAAILPVTGEERYDGFMSELIQARRKFEGGFIGMGYFINKWRSAHLDPTPQARHVVLDELLHEHWLELYDAGGGHAAIRFSERAKDRLGNLGIRPEEISSPEEEEKPALQL